MWFIFHDTRSGGKLKGKWIEICIEADDEKQAKKIFCTYFGHSPDKITCSWCGPDYDVFNVEDLDQYITEVSEYYNMFGGEFRDNILIIRKQDVEKKKMKKAYYEITLGVSVYVDDNVTNVSAELDNLFNADQVFNSNENIHIVSVDIEDIKHIVSDDCVSTV